MLPLVKAPSEMLRKKSKAVKDIGSITQLAGEMVLFLVDHANDDAPPVGISAPQLGQLVRVIAFRKNATEKGDIQVLINPTLVYSKGFRVVTEGCLSLPSKKFKFQRHKTVKIRGLTLEGQQRSFRGRDILAQLLEHELGHLDGILIDQLGERVEK